MTAKGKDGKKTMKSTNRIAAALCLMALAPLVAAAAGWSWEMPGSVYKELDFSSRAGVDRAAKIFNQALDAARRGVRVTDLVPRYRAAVAEWRKVQIQAEAENFDETLISYSLFMQAYSRERAHDLNEAIKLYGELVDLHPDVEWVFIPAKYRLAACHLALGESRKGHRAIDEFVADKAHDGHVLMANALNTQAWRLWGERRYEEAMDDWLRILDDRYAANNRDLWNATHDLLVVMSLVTCDFDRFDEMVFSGVKEDDAKGRYERCRWALDIAFRSIVYGHWGFGERTAERYPDKSERDRKMSEARKWFVDWFAARRETYEKTGHGTDYLFSSLRMCVYLGTADQTAKCLEKVKAYLRSEKNEGTVNSRANEAIGILLERGKADMARTVPDLMKGVLNQCWARYSIESRVGNWKGAAQNLEEYIARKPDPASLKRAKWALADIFRERLGEVEKAVKLYQEIDDPPGTLWALVDCYRRLGKKKEAYVALDEIASIFDKEAARAVLRQAQYREQDGEKAKAIALYKRLLSHPEWKKSGESSQAHQALERLGVATGGAMTNEVR